MDAKLEELKVLLAKCTKHLHNVELVLNAPHAHEDVEAIQRIHKEAQENVAAVEKIIKDHKK